jgi:integrase
MSTARLTAALAALDGYVAELTASQDVSAARARQLRWVAGELRRAAELPGFPQPASGTDGVAALLSAAQVTAYLDAADRGELRRRASAGTGQSTRASRRIRLDCLRMIAAAAHCPPIEERLTPPEPHQVVASRERGELYRYLTEHANHAGANAARVRLLALVGVVLDTGARAGELCAMRLPDLAPDLSSVVVVRRPQAGSAEAPTTERIPLSGASVTALGHWLTVRAGLVRAVQGGASALWVSVRGNHAGTLDVGGAARRRPPGMPLRPRGLARAYTKAIVALNADLAGAPGWQPLPRQLERLRRAIHPDGVEVLSEEGLTNADSRS